MTGFGPPPGVELLGEQPNELDRVLKSLLAALVAFGDDQHVAVPEGHGIVGTGHDERLGHVELEPSLPDDRDVPRALNLHPDLAPVPGVPAGVGIGGGPLVFVDPVVHLLDDGPSVLGVEGGLVVFGDELATESV